MLKQTFLFFIKVLIIGILFNKGLVSFNPSTPLNESAVIQHLPLILPALMPPTVAHAQDNNDPKQALQTVILTDEKGEYPLGLHLEILEDPSSKLTIEDVTSPEYSQQFAQNQKTTPNFGYTQSAYWVRFRVRNEASKTSKWQLALNKADMEYIALYMPLPDQSDFVMKQAGDFLPFTAREVPHRQFIFKLLLPGQTEQTFYLRFQTRAAMTLPLILWSLETFAQNDQTTQLILGFYYGIMLIMATYNLFLFLALRDKSYLYYVLFIASFLLNRAADDGLTSQYLWPNLSRWASFTIVFFAVLAIASGLQFSNSFLMTRIHTPKLHKIISLWLTIAGLVIIVLLFDRQAADLAMNVLALLAIPTLLAAGFIIWQQGYGPARYFLLAWLAFLGGTGLFLLSNLALLPRNAVTQHSMLIGTILMVLLLSLALADRINSIKQERTEAQAKTLKAVQENEKLVLEQNINLEKRVKTRTAELEQEIIERIWVEEKLAQQATLNACMAELAEKLLMAKAIKDIVNLTLKVATELTGSKYGFVGYFDPDTGYLVSPTITQEVWGQCQVSGKEVTFEKFGDLWGWMLDNKEPLLTNDPTGDERSIGTPSGHVPIERFLSVPTVHGDSLVGQIAVANAEQDYNEHDQLTLERLVSVFALGIRRKQTEEALQESEKKYRDLVENISEVIYVTNENGVMTYVSPAIKSFIGYSPAEVLGHSFRDFIYQEDLPHAREGFQQVLYGHTAVNEYRILTKSGQIRWILTSSRPTFTGDRVTGMYGVLSDITERKQAEELLRESEKRSRILFEAAAIVSSTLDVETVLHHIAEQMGQFIDATSTYICSWEAETGTSTVLAEYFGPQACEQERVSDLGVNYEEDQIRFLEKLQAGRFDISNIDDPDLPEAERGHMQQYGAQTVLFIPLLVRGQVIAFAELWESRRRREFTTEEMALAQGIAQNAAIAIENAQLYKQAQQEISERKQIEEALQKAKESAEVANRAKSTFLAHMSHELRTPLNSILGYTQILNRDKTLTNQQRESVAIMQQSGEHLLTLLNDILDLSKIEAGKMELQLAEFHLPNFLKTIVDIFRVRAEQKNIQFVYKNLFDLPIVVQGDEKRLRQVLINLLGNAIKFTQQGGVTFKVDVVGSKEIEPRGGKDIPIQNPKLVFKPLALERSEGPKIQNRKVRFQIEDTGIGIKTEESIAIFAPFRQTGDQRMITEGTGLGLPISKRLVEMMGGELQIKSVIGGGSTFWFDLDLPLFDTWIEASKTEAAQVIGYEGPSRKVLVIDDKRKNRSVLVNMLTALGFELFEAVDGQDGLARAREFEPDLILMDLVMSGYDGFETTRRIRQLPKLKDAVVLAVSASTFSEDRQRSLDAGCDGFIAKPFRLETLLQQVQTHLRLVWTYEGNKETGQVEKDASAPFVLPPAEEIEALFKLALIGNVRGVEKQIAQLEHTNEKYKPFVAQIGQLARNFKTRQLRKLLKSYLE